MSDYSTTTTTTNGQRLDVEVPEAPPRQHRPTSLPASKEFGQQQQQQPRPNFFLPLNSTTSSAVNSGSVRSSKLIFRYAPDKPVDSSGDGGGGGGGDDILKKPSIFSNVFAGITTKFGKEINSCIGKLVIKNRSYVFTSENLTDIGEIGRGSYGTVNKMIHNETKTVMAVKRLRSTVESNERKQLIMDLEVIMKIKPNECSNLVRFYGVLFKEGDCWICMEIMDTSLDKFYKFIYNTLCARIPELILGKIAISTLQALNYLKEKLNIIHRDVKPSNILLDRSGNIKLCDFGISGKLVDSIAQTRDAGCQPYMAPERIDPQRAIGYDVRSDIWSLGITLMEIAIGSFPYPKWSSVFDQLYQVVQGEPPRLHKTYKNYTFSDDFVDFVNTCLIKDEQSRPKYAKLLQHEFMNQSKKSIVNVATYVCDILDQMDRLGVSEFTTNQEIY